MKKFVWLVSLFLALGSKAQAEIYHGIDIDEVYKSSDWNSKEEIKTLIDDYTLLLQYQEEFNACPIELPEVLNCYDKIAKKIITNLYVQPEYNIEDYQQLKKALLKAYGLKNCRNKYAWPSGSICEIKTDSNLAVFLKQYVQSLIQVSKKNMFLYSNILEEYE